MASFIGNIIKTAMPARTYLPESGARLPGSPAPTKTGAIVAAPSAPPGIPGLPRAWRLPLLLAGGAILVLYLRSRSTGGKRRRGRR